MLRTQSDLDAYRGERPGAALVPTMGALHAGHASLIRAAAELARARGGGLAGGAMVTIFVNPTQFNSAADLARYPRTLEADLEVCRQAGASAVFAPEPGTVYPGGAGGGAGGGVRVPALPEVATRPGLEDGFRPGHFAGVCQVVLRLFEMTRPTVAVFGEKDWQQLQVVRAMTAQEGLGIEIVPGETVREADGLALSSRNRFLDAGARERALGLSRALRAAGREATATDAEAAMRAVLGAHGITP
ncbi:MAG: pantoate--beta-alanine ligase, partial [Phycisphaerae bacterium]|nr:pantoate--beta-alanine ligase [Phycisphaerae bacterium]